MGHPIVSTVTLSAAQSTGYALAQSLAGAGPLTLNGALVAGGVGIPDAPRRVGISSVSDDSGITFTVTGTSRPEQGGGVFSETVKGTSGGTAQTTQDFATVTLITASGATAGNVTAGTTGTGSGPWVPWDVNVRTPFEVSVAALVLSGSPTFSVEVTYDDVFGTWLPSGVPFPRAETPISGLKDQTQSAFGTINGTNAGPVRASRLTLTVVGSVQLTQSQQGD